MANDAEERNLLYSHLRQMPEVRKPHPLTTRDTDPNDGTLAVRPVGSKHHGTSPRQTKVAKIPRRWHRLFHQVGGSRTTRDNHGEERRRFVWKMIICRFGIPRAFISDNGRQFDNSPFKEFCEELGIHNHYSSPGHPQANGQVEVTNRSLLKMIKTRLEGAKGLWPEELPNILWAYKMTTRTPTGETPFRLAYGIEAVILVEIGLTTWRTSHHDEDSNDS